MQKELHHTHSLYIYNEQNCKQNQNENGKKFDLNNFFLNFSFIGHCNDKSQCRYSCADYRDVNKLK